MGDWTELQETTSWRHGAGAAADAGPAATVMIIMIIIIMLIMASFTFPPTEVLDVRAS